MRVSWLVAQASPMSEARAAAVRGASESTWLVSLAWCSAGSASSSGAWDRGAARARGRCARSAGARPRRPLDTGRRCPMRRVTPGRDAPVVAKGGGNAPCCRSRSGTATWGCTGTAEGSRCASARAAAVQCVASPRGAGPISGSTGRFQDAARRHCPRAPAPCSHRLRGARGGARVSRRARAWGAGACGGRCCISPQGTHSPR